MLEHTCPIPFPVEYTHLEMLIDQQQFELIDLPPADHRRCDLRLVYLMNDAAESFLVFRQAYVTGEYLPEYDGELSATLGQNDDAYSLAVHQGKTAFTVFFTDLTQEDHLFNYGRTGHFWVKNYEYLRQLEYRIAILRDKREYLGKESCTEEELRLSRLAEFPPLNFCSYPAVPPEYLIPSSDWWYLSEGALVEMLELAQEAGDDVLKKDLIFYGRHPGKWTARWIAGLFHQTNHATIVDLITRKLTEEAEKYPDRIFTGEEVEKIQFLKRKGQSFFSWDWPNYNYSNSLSDASLDMNLKQCPGEVTPTAMNSRTVTNSEPSRPGSVALPENPVKARPCGWLFPPLAPMPKNSHCADAGFY